MSSVDVRNNVVEGTADGDEVGDFTAFGDEVDDGYQWQAGGTEFYPVRVFVAPAFEVDAEFSAAGFHAFEVVTFRQFDERFGLHGVVARGDVVYQLFQYM